MDEPPTVYVVDDDDAVRESLRYLIEAIDLRVRTFGSAKEFLDGCGRDAVGCLVLDVRMPGMSGLELQERLSDNGIHLPVIIITAHGDVPMAVRAMKRGAADFIEKPFNDQLLLDRIQKAIQGGFTSRDRQRALCEVRQCMAQLTQREREVLTGVVAGKPNRVIANELDLSEKTIEVHRARLMKKMAADSLAELVRKVVELEQEDGPVQ
jgi:FixJ family two-component response regulator